MKQHLSKEQLLSLSEEQRQKLREWWRPSKGDLYAYLVDEDTTPYVVTGDHERFDENYSQENDLVPLLSLGQCIAFLEEHKPDFDCIQKYEGQNPIWDVGHYYESSPIGGEDGYYGSLISYAKDGRPE